jgi:hypothetical protein
MIVCEPDGQFLFSCFAARRQQQHSSARFAITLAGCRQQYQGRNHHAWCHAPFLGAGRTIVVLHQWCAASNILHPPIPLPIYSLTQAPPRYSVCVCARLSSSSASPQQQQQQRQQVSRLSHARVGDGIAPCCCCCCKQSGWNLWGRASVLPMPRRKRKQPSRKVSQDHQQQENQEREEDSLLRRTAQTSRRTRSC